jgi:hypothetical protein
MANKERIREPLSGLPTLEHLVERVEAGWKPVAIEWEREARGAALATNEHEMEEIPYGLRVSDDGTGLVASESERQIVIIALDMIVEDCPLSQVADELNRRGNDDVRLRDALKRGQPRIGHGDDADVRVDRAERIIRRLRFARACDGVEEGGFADVGKADDACGKHGDEWWTGKLMDYWVSADPHKDDVGAKKRPPSRGPSQRDTGRRA